MIFVIIILLLILMWYQANKTEIWGILMDVLSATNIIINR